MQKEFYEDQIRFGNKTKALLKSTTQCTVAKNDEMNDLIEDRVKLILTIRKLELQNKALRADYESITLKEIGHVADIKKTAGATNIVMQPDSVQKDKNEFIKKVNEQQSE